MKSSEVELIFDRILTEDLILNNTNVIFLQEFIASWTNTAIREGVFCQFFQNWVKQVHLLHQQNALKNGPCIVTILLLEVCLNNVDLDQNSQYYSLISQTFVPFHKLIVSECLTNANELTSSNDAVIAFFRFHCCISRKTKGAQLIRKYNLWKTILLFYFNSNRFNFFIQNLCTEYIDNLISAELPNELILFLEVLNTSIHCIKDVLENQPPQWDGVLFRSLRISHLLLSKHLIGLDNNSLRMISKQCLSLKSYIRRLIFLPKQEIIVGISLKLFILLKIYLSDVEDEKDEDKIFRVFVATTYQLLSENEKFNRYVPEIFNMKFGNVEEEMKLRTCSAYLQVRTIAEYLIQLDSFSLESVEIDLRVPEAEVFGRFFELYHEQLLKQNQLAAISTSILKNFCSEKNSLDKDTRIYFIRSFSSLLNLFSNNTKKVPGELSNLILNIMNASSMLITMETELLENERIFSQFLKTLLQLTQPNVQLSIMIRLSAFKLCHLILRKIGRISGEVVDSCKAVLIQGLDDPCWEVRDSTLELLHEILISVDSTAEETLVAREDISNLLLNKLKDEESFVRATAYSVLTASISHDNRSLWRKHLDYNKILEETCERFQNETEGNVREKMIQLIIEGWLSFEISDFSLLGTIFETIYKASTDDLHSEVRRSGMVFWKNLLQQLTQHSTQSRRNGLEFLQKLSFTGCLQAIISGIEDEYDPEIADTALNALLILKSVTQTVNASKSENLVISMDNHLWNKLPISDFVKSDFLSAEQFVAMYLVSDSKFSVLQNSNKEYELDLSTISTCFVCGNPEGSEINQKDCY